MRRDGFFDARGFRTLRFWNHEIDRELNSVVETIWQALQETRRRGSRGANIWFADRACLALALENRLPVLTGDGKWSELGLSLDIRLIR